MAFKRLATQAAVADGPHSLFHDLPRRRHTSLFDHQGHMLRTYMAHGIEAPDVALRYRREAARRSSGCVLPSNVDESFASGSSIFIPPG